MVYHSNAVAAMDCRLPSMDNPDQTIPTHTDKELRWRELKLDVMKRRRSLKGSGIVIVDDLCLDIVQTLSRLKALPTVTNSWSWDSKLFAQIPSSTIAVRRNP